MSHAIRSEIRQFPDQVYILFVEKVTEAGSSTPCPLGGNSKGATAKAGSHTSQSDICKKAHIAPKAKPETSSKLMLIMGCY
jgi:hypothetical protein